MKKEERIRQIEEKYNVYVADDGEVFSKEELCLEYEKTVRCVLNKRFNAIAKKITKGYSAVDELIEDGYQNGEYYLVTLHDDSELNTTLFWLKNHDASLSETTKEGSVWLGLDRIKVGGTYIVDGRDGWSGIVSLESIKDMVSRNMDTVERLFNGTIDEEEKND